MPAQCYRREEWRSSHIAGNDILWRGGDWGEGVLRERGCISEIPLSSPFLPMTTIRKCRKWPGSYLPSCVTNRPSRWQLNNPGHCWVGPGHTLQYLPFRSADWLLNHPLTSLFLLHQPPSPPTPLFFTQFENAPNYGNKVGTLVNQSTCQPVEIFFLRKTQSLHALSSNFTLLVSPKPKHLFFLIAWTIVWHRKIPNVLME